MATGPLEPAPAPAGRRAAAFACYDPDGHALYLIAEGGAGEDEL